MNTFYIFIVDKSFKTHTYLILVTVVIVAHFGKKSINNKMVFP